MKSIKFDMVDKRCHIVLLLILLAVLMLAALANGAGPYELNWYTIDGGGGRSSGGDFTLTSTIGQPE
jgi:hypothetical protein